MKVIKESKTIPYGDVRNPVMLTNSQIRKYEIIPFKQNSTFQDAQAQLENIRKEFPDAKAGINDDYYKNISIQDIYPEYCFIFYKKSKNESY